MGGDSGGKTSQNTTQNIDPSLKPLFTNTADIVGGIQTGLNQGGYFGQFFNQNPQQIPNLSQGQQSVLGAYGARAFGDPANAYDIAGTGYAQGAGQLNAQEASALGVAPTLGNLNNPEQAALGQIDRFTSGEIGSSPATKAAMAAVRTPVMNDLAMAGLGNSDALASSLGGAYAPILAQELAIRAGAIPQLASIGAQQRGGQLAGAQLQTGIGQALRGGQQFGAQFLGQQGQNLDTRQAGNLSTYFGGEEAARQIEAQRGQANLADFLRQQGLMSQYTTGILSGMPTITSSNVVGKTSGGGK